MRYSIGEFSKISRLSVKTLRYYHEIGLLVPGHVDTGTAYRYYNERSLEKAGIILKLKDLDFSLDEIKDILARYRDDADIADFMRSKSAEISAKVARYRRMQRQVELFLRLTKESAMCNKSNNIIVKRIDDMTIASIRYKGTYSEMGKYFGKIFKECGMSVCGHPFSLYYDEGYVEEGADIEACVPVRKEVKSGTITCRVLRGGQAHTLIHRGPYETLTASYKKIIDFLRANSIAPVPPCREVYLKGPGMILKGNPKRYVTEIQMFSA